MAEASSRIPCWPPSRQIPNEGTKTSKVHGEHVQEEAGAAVNHV